MWRALDGQLAWPRARSVPRGAGGRPARGCGAAPAGAPGAVCRPVHSPRGSRVHHPGHGPPGGWAPAGPPRGAPPPASPRGAAQAAGHAPGAAGASPPSPGPARPGAPLGGPWGRWPWQGASPRASHTAAGACHRQTPPQSLAGRPHLWCLEIGSRRGARPGGSPGPGGGGPGGDGRPPWPGARPPYACPHGPAGAPADQASARRGAPAPGQTPARRAEALQRLQASRRVAAAS